MHYLLIAFAIIIQTSLQANFLLTPPDPIQALEFDIPEKKKTSFCWNGKNCQIHFEYAHPQASFKLLINSEVYTQLSRSEQIKWVNITQDKYEYKWPRAEQKQIVSDDQKKEEPNYYLAEPRVISNTTPRIYTEAQIAEYIKYKKIIFYTGAGISAAADTWTMQQLEQKLCITNIRTDKKLRLTYFLEHALNQSEELCSVFSQFCQGLFEHAPTKAHWALKELSLYKKCKIITENLDFLHQRTGISPTIPSSTIITATDLQALDAIVCIGLSHDDRGLLSLFKQINPKGLIIALDLQKPNYLDSHDILIKQDIQKLLPELLYLIMK
jgi:NAD-dependent SIR2 family protein deacetylase